MSLSIIGAGLGRTGTLSLKGALEKLGFEPCYHMTEISNVPHHRPLWRRLVDGGTVDWEEIFADFKATLDWPACHYWRELTARYPDAKVILTVRDGGRWYDSIANTIYPVLLDSLSDPEKSERSAMARKLIFELTFKGRIDDRDYAIGVYEAHNAAVQAAFSPDRLLTYNVAEGWAPLCAFLGIDVPDEDFPRTNTTDEFRGRTGLDSET